MIRARLGVIGFVLAMGVAGCGTPAAEVSAPVAPLAGSVATTAVPTTLAPTTLAPTTISSSSTATTATTAASPATTASTTTVAAPTTLAPATTQVAQAPTVVVSALRRDADGYDNLAENKNDEWVEITNQGPGTADLTGWSIEDEGANHRFRFPADFELDDGAAVKVRSGCGSDTDTDLYWCNSGSAVWNNDGDTAFLFDPLGALVDTS